MKLFCDYKNTEIQEMEEELGKETSLQLTLGKPTQTMVDNFDVFETTDIIKHVIYLSYKHGVSRYTVLERIKQEIEANF